MKESFCLSVETYIGDADEPESERVIDHADGIHREWLQRHIFWSMRNGREVHLIPERKENETL